MSKLTRNKKISIQAQALKHIIDNRKLEHPLEAYRLKINNIKFPKKKISSFAKIIVDQDEFIQREILVTELLKFYVCNQLDFYAVVSDEVRKKYNFNEEKPEYVWESMDELACGIAGGEVYLRGNGIFTAWVIEKTKNKLTVEAAAIECIQYCTGGI